MWLDANGAVNVITDNDRVWSAASESLIARIRALDPDEFAELDDFVDEFWASRIEVDEDGVIDLGEEAKWENKSLPADIVLVDDAGEVVDVVRRQLEATPHRWQVDLAQSTMMILGRIADAN